MNTIILGIVLSLSSFAQTSWARDLFFDCLPDGTDQVKINRLRLDFSDENAPAKMTVAFSDGKTSIRDMTFAMDGDIFGFRQKENTDFRIDVAVSPGDGEYAAVAFQMGRRDGVISPIMTSILTCSVKAGLPNMKRNSKRESKPI